MKKIVFVAASLFTTVNMQGQMKEVETSMNEEQLVANQANTEEYVAIDHATTYKAKELEVKKDTTTSYTTIMTDESKKKERISRYFYSSSGYGLKKGQNYYQNTMLFYNQVNFGLSDHFSIGAGGSMIPMIAGIIWVNPKLSVPVVKDRLNVGVSATVSNIVGTDAIYGMLNGVVTIGPREYNLTFGVSRKMGVEIGYSSMGMADNLDYSLSGAFMITESFYFITENHFMEDNMILTSGVKMYFGKVGVDLGLASFRSKMGPVYDDYDHGVKYMVEARVPTVGVTVPF